MVYSKHDRERKLVECIQSKGFPIYGIPDGKMDFARELLSYMHPNGIYIKGGKLVSPVVKDASGRYVVSSNQVRRVLRKDYDAAKTKIRISMAEEKIHSGLEVDVERISGLEAEELGLCGCVSWHRNKY